MGIWGKLLISLSISLILPVAFSFFWFCKVRGEKKISPRAVIRTCPPKTLTGFFLGFAFFILFGGIAAVVFCCIADSENITVSAIIVLSACIAVFSAMGFFGYAFVRFNYVVADAEGLYAYRLFRKKRYYRYEEIGSFQDTMRLGTMGGLKGYDKNGKKIFTIEAAHFGANAVAQRLRDHGVREQK